MNARIGAELQCLPCGPERLVELAGKEVRPADAEAAPRQGVELHGPLRMRDTLFKPPHDSEMKHVPAVGFRGADRDRADVGERHREFAP